RALRRGDPAVVTEVLSGLATTWGITGDNARLFAVADAVEQVLAGWEPPPHLRESALEVVGWLLVHVSWLPGRDVAPLRATLAALGEPHGPFARIAHATFVAAPRSGTPVVDALLALADADDPRLAPQAHMWAALVAENAAEPDRARAAAVDGLRLSPPSPWVRAALEAQLAQLDSAAGCYPQAARHAEAAWPVLARLHAHDDAQSLRLGIATALMLDGHHDEAERRLDEVAAEGVSGTSARLTLLAARAELALARGRTTEAFTLFDDAVLAVADADDFAGLRDQPTLTPWLLLAASAALVARVRFGSDEADRARATQLRDVLAGPLMAAEPALVFVDLPLSGSAHAAVAAWYLRWGPERAAAHGIRLLEVARRWSYNRAFPVMAWDGLAALAEARRPGLLAEVAAEYAERSPTELVGEGRALLLRVTADG
ncbi:MAG: hypothetical protein ACRCSN_07100, partial [Dermatophilaceae bacterium]